MSIYIVTYVTFVHFFKKIRSNYSCYSMTLSQVDNVEMRLFPIKLCGILENEQTCQFDYLYQRMTLDLLLPFLAILNNLAMNMLAHLSLCTDILISIG